MNRFVFSNLFAGLMILAISVSGQNDGYKQSRQNMADEQIEGRGIRDKAVLAAMRTVPRHLFVPEAYREVAYNDGPLPIGYGQTISQPYIVAYMTEQIRPKPGFKVLEIGTGSGYQAAILAEIVGQVYTVEIVEELGKAAAERLKKLHYDQVHVKIGDGYSGWEEEAPFDAIVVTAAADFVPPPLISQLKPGGRMIIPVGSPFQVQMLKLVEKKDDRVITQNLLPVRFVPFTRKE
ncbi:protein-L-isoaspartate(D-aspartate) O-methyltransferase [Gaoshiqia sp. Z1-71]|uniref:protein-L-isoaspartate(D-aspartate) O-methyltransferase n=1 Tax=Gaoshiqia hydrogeniformans TaxID=3290090 RepID=UPI003BF7CE0F